MGQRRDARFALSAQGLHASLRRCRNAGEPTLSSLQPAMSAAFARGAILLGLWIVLAGADPAGLPFGLLAAVLGARVSLRLLPPRPGRVAPLALLRLFGLVMRQSLAGGLDVAMRAFARTPRLAPGVIAVPVGFPPGAQRDAFRVLASLAPGSLPLEDRPDGTLRLHALDTGLPLARDAADAAAALARCRAGGVDG